MYIKGATAEPWVRTIRAPNKARIIKIGINQIFFLEIKYLDISDINENIKTGHSY